MGNEFTMEDVLIVLRRRMKAFLIPVIVLTPLLIIGIMLMPAMYTSSGVLLIQSPQISSELVQSANSLRAQERIEIIRTRISARSELLKIAEDTNLFPNWLGYSETKKHEKMKRRFKVSPVANQIVNGQNGQETYAFEVGYTDPSPLKATAVANELINRFESKDRQQTIKDASDTTEFFEKQVTQFTADLNTKQQEIAAFKKDNNGSLPEQLPLHTRQLERFTTQMSNLDNQIRALDEDKRFIESQMASNVSGGGNENSPEARLLTLKAQLAEQRAIYTDSHPQIQSLKSEIAALERQLSPGRELQRLQRDVDEAEEKILDARKNEASEEEIALLIAEADRLSDQFIRKATTAGGLSSSAQNYLLQSSLVSLQKRGRSLDERSKQLQERIDDLEDRISRTPAVESVLNDLLRQQASLEELLEENVENLRTAQQSENLQVEDRAERILQIEPAVLPEKPSSPNRPALIVVATLFAGMIGALSVLATEFLNATVRGRAHLSNILDEPPLAIIPYIQGTEEKGFSLPFFGKSRSARNNKGDMGADDLGVVAAE